MRPSLDWASAAAAAAGEVLYAVLGLMLGEPQVTWAAVRQVLPSAVGYDMLLSPFVLYLVVKLYGWAGGAGQAGPAAAMSSAAAGALGAAGLAPAPPAGQRVRLAAPAPGPPGAAPPGSGPPRVGPPGPAAPAPVAAGSAVRGWVGVSRGCGAPAGRQPRRAAPARAGPAHPAQAAPR